MDADNYKDDYKQESSMNPLSPFFVPSPLSLESAILPTSPSQYPNCTSSSTSSPFHLSPPPASPISSNSIRTDFECTTNPSKRKASQLNFHGAATDSATPSVRCNSQEDDRVRKRRAAHRKYDTRRKGALRHVVSELKDCIQSGMVQQLQPPYGWSTGDGPRVPQHAVLRAAIDSIRQLCALKDKLEQETQRLEVSSADGDRVDECDVSGEVLTPLASLLHTISIVRRGYSREVSAVRAFQHRLPLYTLDSLGDYFESFGVTGCDGRIIYYKPEHKSPHWENLARCDERFGRCSRSNHFHAVISMISKTFAEGWDDKQKCEKFEIEERQVKQIDEMEVNDGMIRQMLANSLNIGSSTTSTSSSSPHPLRRFGLPASSHVALRHTLAYLSSLSPAAYAEKLSIISNCLPAFGSSVCPGCIGTEANNTRSWTGQQIEMTAELRDKEIKWHEMFLPTYEEIQLFHQLYNEGKSMATLKGGKTPTKDYGVVYFDVDVLQITDSTGYPLAHVVRPRIYSEQTNKNMKIDSASNAISI